VKKELRPIHDDVQCDVCERTILKGERTEAYLVPGGQRKLVCELCFGRAENAGWIRESAHDETPARGPRPQERRPFLGRLRGRRSAEPSDNGIPTEPPAAPLAPEEAEPELEPAADVAQASPGPRSVPKDPRHVRAIPTAADAKVERALEVFNGSEHARTVVGLTRTLGSPWVTALPAMDAPSQVIIVVAWELSWYRYRVELGDGAEPVELQEKGEEIDEIDETLRGWNASVAESGDLMLGVAAE